MPKRSWCNDDVRVDTPGVPTEDFARFFRRWFRPLVRVGHRPSISGLENLPTEGPYMLVANHSGGTGQAELLSFVSLWLDNFGTSRPLAGMVHPMDFRMAFTRWLARGLGTIPSTYPAALRTIAAGIPVMIMPGGDHESLIPFWKRNRVDFNGRTGFLRIAAEARIPIVPMGISGGQMTCPVLLRSRLMAAINPFTLLLGLKRWGLSLPGLAGAALIATLIPAPWWIRAIAVWIWLCTPLAFAPCIPFKITMRIGQPILPADIFGDTPGTPSDDQFRQALDIVESNVRDLLTDRSHDKEPAA